MAHTQEITLRREPWSGAALADLGPVMPDRENHGADGMRADVEAGRVALFGIHADGARAGSIACRFDDFAMGSDFVVVAAAARVPHVDLTNPVLAYFEDFARAKGATHMRIHTARRGLVRKLARRGYRTDHVVMLKDLAA